MVGYLAKYACLHPLKGRLQNSKSTKIQVQKKSTATCEGSRKTRANPTRPPTGGSFSHFHNYRNVE